MPTILRLPGSRALSDFRLDKLLQQAAPATADSKLVDKKTKGEEEKKIQ